MNKTITSNLTKLQDYEISAAVILAAVYKCNCLNFKNRTYKSLCNSQVMQKSMSISQLCNHGNQALMTRQLQHNDRR